MNLSGFYTQDLTLTLNASSALRLDSHGQGATSGTFTSATAFSATAIRADTVTLSPDAVSHAASIAKSPGVPSPATPTATPGGAALFDALDVDEDGAVSRQEFVDGARTLLRHANRGHHYGHDHIGRSEHGRHGSNLHDEVEGASHGRHRHGNHGLSNRLGRVFDQVDANEDGAVDKAELESALARARGESPAESPVPVQAETNSTAPAAADQVALAGETGPVVPIADGGGDAETAVSAAVDESAAEPTSESSTAPFVSVAQITIVTVAIQQYTTVSPGDLATPLRTIDTTV